MQAFSGAETEAGRDALCQSIPTHYEGKAKEVSVVTTHVGALRRVTCDAETSPPKYLGIGDRETALRSRLSAAEGHMPRYYFDISDGGLTVDDVGLEYPNAHVARDQAIKTLPNLAQDHIAEGPSREVVVLMRNEAGKALFMSSLTLTAKWLVDTA